MNIKLTPKPRPVRGDETCKHKHVECRVDFMRLENQNHFTADIRITCLDCKVPFRFKGLPAGLSFSEPRVGINGEELRAPMEPAYVEELVGMNTPPVKLTPGDL